MEQKLNLIPAWCGRLNFSLIVACCGRAVIPLLAAYQLRSDTIILQLMVIGHHAVGCHQWCSVDTSSSVFQDCDCLFDHHYCVGIATDLNQEVRDQVIPKQSAPTKASELNCICEMHNRPLSFGCTICYYFVCKDCTIDQQSIKQECPRKGEQQFCFVLFHLFHHNGCKS